MGDALKVFDTPADLATAAADQIVSVLREAVESRGSASFALAGGSTPRATYEELARRGNSEWWESVEFFWSDERVVPPTDPASNVGMARAALLDPLNVDSTRIHAPRTDLGRDDAAVNYEIEIRTVLGDATPSFDLVLLGMGDDGHTASLFPDGDELEASTSRLVVGSTAPFDPPERVTFTLPLLAAARNVTFLVAGEKKASMLRRALDGDTDLPSARVRPADGTLSWFVDRAAAG